MQTDMTLDEAIDAFDAYPCQRTAHDLLREATQYWSDEMIGDEEYQDAVKKVTEFLSVTSGKEFA